jgi:starch-binding outer membrane protein, SusD/RagB family
MNTLYKYLLITVTVIVLVVGCRDHLDLTPLDAPSNVTFYENQDQLFLALNGAYRQTFYLFYGWLPSIAFEQLDLMTDLGYERSHSGVKSIALGSHDSQTNEIIQTWNHFYRAIARVNSLLDNMHKAENMVTPQIYQQVQAEARFLRAFSYFYLSELYGDVPLLTSVPDPENAQIGRSPKAEVVDQIIADLDFAAGILPEKWTGENEGRVTKGAALALKSRVALFNERYSVAAQAAQAVMNLEAYTLYPDYKNLTLYAGKRNSEVILDVPFKIGVQTSRLPRSRGSQNWFGWSLSVPSQFLVDSYEATDGKPIDESSIYNPANPFVNRDPRLYGSIILPQTIWGDFIFESQVDSAEAWLVNNAGQKIGRFTNWDQSVYGTFTGYLWKKYNDPLDYPEKIENSEVNYILMRYAEVLLIYAEAKIEAQEIDASVLSAINQVRARAYGTNPANTTAYPAISTTNQSELRKIVRRERKVEFAGEGLRIFDIRRWRIAEQVMNGPLVGRPHGSYASVSAPAINDATGHPYYGNQLNLYRNVETRNFNPARHYLWPIPQPELNVNKAMEQNPGY